MCVCTAIICSIVNFFVAEKNRSIPLTNPIENVTTGLYTGFNETTFVSNLQCKCEASLSLKSDQLADSRIHHLSFSFKINISQFYNWSSHPRSGHIFSHFFHCLLLQAQGTALLLYTDFNCMDSVFTDNWNTGLVLVGILFKTEFDLELEMFKYLKL